MSEDSHVPESSLEHPLIAELSLDKDGFLSRMEDWSPKIAELLAANIGISLTEEHWQVIRLLRSFYQKSGRSPAMRPLVKLVRNEMGEVKGTSLYLLKLFPDSPALKACRIAGLPRPTNCL